MLHPNKCGNLQSSSSSSQNEEHGRNDIDGWTLIKFSSAMSMTSCENNRSNGKKRS